MITETQQLTNEQLTYWRRRYNEVISRQIKPLDELQEIGTFWIYRAGVSFGFYNLYHCTHTLQQETINKVSKMKVGDKYRRDVMGWIVPNDLIEEFRQCIEISRLYRKLTSDALDAIEKAGRNRRKIINLSPEQKQTLIDMFVEFD